MLRRCVLAFVIVASLVTACSSSGAPTPGPTVAASPAATPTMDPAYIHAKFDIGGGRELFLRCKGLGSPAILMEAGDASTAEGQWYAVSEALSEATRECQYDRAGLGLSSPATGCRELADLNDDLDALLAAADIPGPFVLVGASGGGALMAGWAERHPDQVAGMVFVDVAKAMKPDTASMFPDLGCDSPNNVEHRDYPTVEQDAWNNRKPLGDFPLTVISNDYGDAAAPGSDDATNVEDQRGWFDLSPDHATQIVVTTGHDVPYNQPDLVIKAILDVLAAARAAA